ncbi:MAG: outer membrane beta-barrel protein [Bacteroidaceae bacterium]|nr:outer membrane beta-barrel protein [Bacteroidaceae bacterium]
MRKKLLFAAVALLLSCTAGAQNYWTVKGGLNFTHPVAPSPYNYNTGVGAQMGLTYSVQLPKNFYFVPGVSVAYRSWKFSDFAVDAIGDMLAEREDNKFRECEIAVPLYIDYVIPIDPVGFHVFTGPQLYCSACNKFKSEVVIGGYDFGQTYDMFDNGMFEYNRFGLAYNVGAGITFGQHCSLDFTASFGLTHLGKDCGYTIRKNAYALTFGYSF